MYRERFLDKKTGKKVLVSVTLNSDSRHAQKMAAEMLREKFQNKMDSPQTERAARLDSLTLAAVCEEWITTSDLTVKELTRRNHRAVIRKMLSLLPPGILFQDFTPAKLEKIVNSLYYLDCLSYNYVNGLLILAKATMKYAKKAGYIQDVTDFEEIRLKKRPITPDELKKKENKFLNQEELRSCLDQLAKLNYRVSLAMEFISLTGLRCGELLALRREDVDLDNRQLKVTGTLVNTRRNGDELQRGTPKNIYSYRTVDLNTRAVQILEWFYTDNKRQELWGRHGNNLCSMYKDRGYIFTTRTGEPYNLPYIDSLLRKINIPGKHISSHIFRHTHITMLAAMGVPIKAIMRRVGHNKAETTLAIYTHVTDEMQREVCDKLDTLAIREKCAH